MNLYPELGAFITLVISTNLFRTQKNICKLVAKMIFFIALGPRGDQHLDTTIRSQKHAEAFVWSISRLSMLREDLIKKSCTPQYSFHEKELSMLGEMAIGQSQINRAVMNGLIGSMLEKIQKLEFLCLNQPKSLMASKYIKTIRSIYMRCTPFIGKNEMIQDLVEMMLRSKIREVILNHAHSDDLEALTLKQINSNDALRLAQCHPTCAKAFGVNLKRKLGDQRDIQEEQDACGKKMAIFDGTDGQPSPCHRGNLSNDNNIDILREKIVEVELFKENDSEDFVYPEKHITKDHDDLATDIDDRWMQMVMMRNACKESNPDFQSSDEIHATFPNLKSVGQLSSSALLAQCCCEFSHAFIDKLWLCGQQRSCLFSRLSFSSQTSVLFRCRYALCLEIGRLVGIISRRPNLSSQELQHLLLPLVRASQYYPSIWETWIISLTLLMIQSQNDSPALLLIQSGEMLQKQWETSTPRDGQKHTPNYLSLTSFFPVNQFGLIQCFLQRPTAPIQYENLNEEINHVVACRGDDGDMQREPRCELVRIWITALIFNHWMTKAEEMISTFYLNYPGQHLQLHQDADDLDGTSDHDDTSHFGRAIEPVIRYLSWCYHPYHHDSRYQLGLDFELVAMQLAKTWKMLRHLSPQMPSISSNSPIPPLPLNRMNPIISASLKKIMALVVDHRHVACRRLILAFFKIELNPTIWISWLERISTSKHSFWMVREVIEILEGDDRVGDPESLEKMIEFLERWLENQPKDQDVIKRIIAIWHKRRPTISDEQWQTIQDWIDRQVPIEKI